MKRMRFEETMVGIAGELAGTPNVKHFEWKIKAFFSLAESKGAYYKSKTFYFFNKYWHLRIFPGGCEEASDGYCSLFLIQETPGDLVMDDVSFLIGFSEDNGRFNTMKRNSLSFASPVSGVIDYATRSMLLENKSKLMPSDILTVTCVMWQGKPSELHGIELMELDSLSKNMEDLFTRGNFDTTLNVKGKEFQVHRSMLAARSSVFAAMFEHNMSENATGIVHIPDCDPEAFEDFLRYLYSGRLLAQCLSSALHLYFIAVKYELQELKTLCVQTMVKYLNVGNFTEVVLCAEQYDESELLSAVQYFFNENLKEIVLTEKWDALLKDNPCLGNKLLVGMSEELPPDDEIPEVLPVPEERELPERPDDRQPDYQSDRMTDTSDEDDY